MSGKTKINIKKEDLISLYVDQELPSRQIAEILGVGFRTVLRRLHQFNIPLRPAGDKPFPVLRDKSWLEKQYKTKSTLEIADEIGCSCHIVYDWLVKHKIKIAKDKHRTGKKFSEEARKRLSEAKKGKYTGADHWNWKPNKENSYQSERTSYKAKQWSKDVRERDNHTCVKCENKERLHAHHVKSFKEYPELRYDLNNGITLCVSCHQKEHKRPFPSWLFGQEEIPKSAEHS